MKLDLKEIITSPFEDPRWGQKLGLWLLCYFLCITTPIIIGYHLEVIRQSANGEDGRLPEFHDAGKFWKQGFVFYLLYALMFAIPGAVNLGLLGFVSTWTNGPHGVEFYGPAGLSPLWVLVPFIAVHVLICLAALLAAPAALLRYAMTERASSIFDLKNFWSDFSQGRKDYLMISVGLPLMMTASLFFLALTGIGFLLVIPATPLFAFIHARAIGLYYRVYFD